VWLSIQHKNKRSHTNLRSSEVPSFPQSFLFCVSGRSAAILCRQRLTPALEHLAGKVIAFTDHERNKVTSQDQNERKMMPFKSDHSHDDHGDAMSIL